MTNDPKWLSKRGIKIGYLNIRYLQSKTDEIPYLLSKAKDNFHIFCISETHLKNGVDYKSQLSVPGYHYVNKCPSKPMETGMLLYHSHNINIKRLEEFEKYEVESFWIEIKVKATKPFRVGFIYRNPAEKADWFDNFSNMMEAVSVQPTDIFIFGDMNINILQPHPTWKKTYQKFNLTQVLKNPTRIAKKSTTLIDHIYATNKKSLVETSSSLYGNSDHNAVCATWSQKNVKIPKIGHTTIQFRNMSKFNENNFLLDLQNAGLSHVYQLPDPDEALEYWVNTFTKVYDKHAPLQTKRVKDTLSKEWFNSDLAEAMKIRDETDQTDPNHNSLRNKVTTLRRSAKKQHITDLVEKKAGSKQIWKGINCITNNEVHKRPPPITEVEANQLNNHFNSVPQKTVTIDNTDQNDLTKLKEYCDKKNIEDAAKLPFMTLPQVYNDLRKLKQSNSRGLDNIDAKILKKSAHIIADSLTFIYNQCIAKNYFPEALKKAKIIPIFKSGDKNDPSNYRPIAILPIIAKPFEKHMEKQLNSHMTRYHLITDNQSGFRKNHSCHTAITNLIEKFHVNIKDELLTGVIYADFAKAFDVIDHKLLLKKLKVYKISDNFLKMFESYLHNRKHLVSINLKESSLLTQNYGVPQGSILGPLLFSIYINDLPLNIPNANCEMFADDTTMHTNDANVKTLSKKMQKIIDNLIKWTEHNHMALNAKKTKAMLVTTDQKRRKLLVSTDQKRHYLPIKLKRLNSKKTNAMLVTTDKKRRKNASNSRSKKTLHTYLPIKLNPLNIQGKIIEEVGSHLLLGVTIQNNLSWSIYLGDLTKKISNKVNLLNLIKHFLNQKCKKIFFHAYIQSLINYASTLWDQTSKTDIKPIEANYKRAIKHILQKPSLENHDYINADILPFDKNLKLKKATFIHKIINKNAPIPLQNLLKENENRNYHNELSVCSKPRIEGFTKSLQYSGAKLWNALPQNLRDTKQTGAFKKQFKRILFSTI